MARLEIFGFDCGTTNWRIYRHSCEEPPSGARLGDPQCVALRAFVNHQLPAALLLDDRGNVLSYGNDAYELAHGDPALRPFLRDAFKLCLGNRGAIDPMDPTHRYSHDQALDCTRSLLKLVLRWLGEEKLCGFGAGQRFYFAHPVHWGQETEDGSITGGVLPDFADAVRECFPEPIRPHVHFVREPDGALTSLAQLGQLSAGDGYTLVVDAGGGTTDFVAGRWSAEGLRDVRRYGEPLGGGIFDNDLAGYVAKELGLSDKEQEGAWADLRHYGCQLKESLSRRMLVDEQQPMMISKKILLELPGGENERIIRDCQLQFGREEFERRTRHTAKDLERLVLRAVVRMDLKPKEIGQVVLVGGGSNLYLVPRCCGRLSRRCLWSTGATRPRRRSRGAQCYGVPGPGPGRHSPLTNRCSILSRN
jgi:hypothetical protein